MKMKMERIVSERRINDNQKCKPATPPGEGN